MSLKLILFFCPKRVLYIFFKILALPSHDMKHVTFCNYYRFEMNALFIGFKKYVHKSLISNYSSKMHLQK